MSETSLKHEKMQGESDANEGMPVPGAALLPQTELVHFVSVLFNQKERFLSVLKDRPAPLYLLDAAVLKGKARKFAAAFGKWFPDAGRYFAVKSNNHPMVAGVLLKEGFGLDVSGGPELEMALAAGARDIVFSGPGKTGMELEAAADHPDRVVVLLDSFGELDRLRRIAEEKNRQVRCGVRLTVDPAGLWRKFGIEPKALPAFMEKATDSGWIQLSGLQFHSSWNMSPDRQAAFIRTLGNTLAGIARRFTRQIRFVDIGGGYWPECGEWLRPSGIPETGRGRGAGIGLRQPEPHYRNPASPIEVFARDIAMAVQGHLFPGLGRECRICLEPGRWIIHDAVHLLMTVVDKKGVDLAITDAGTNAVGWERFETDYFPVLNLSRPSLEEKACDILGSLCTPHDVWGSSYFGEDIRPGDILMIPSQGAYTYSLRQQFIKPVPEMAAIE